VLDSAVSPHKVRRNRRDSGRSQQPPAPRSRPRKRVLQRSKVSAASLVPLVQSVRPFIGQNATKASVLAALTSRLGGNSKQAALYFDVLTQNGVISCDNGQISINNGLDTRTVVNQGVRESPGANGGARVVPSPHPPRQQRRVKEYVAFYPERIATTGKPWKARVRSKESFFATEPEATRAAAQWVDQFSVLKKPPKNAKAGSKTSHFHGVLWDRKKWIGRLNITVGGRRKQVRADVTHKTDQAIVARSLNELCKKHGKAAKNTVKMFQLYAQKASSS